MSEGIRHTSPRRMLGMLTCREVEEFLLDYLEGELPFGVRMKFRLHIAMCAECKLYIARYQTAVELGHAAFHDPSASADASVPEDLIAAILAAQQET